MTNRDTEGRWLDGASTPNWTYVRPRDAAREGGAEQRVKRRKEKRRRRRRRRTGSTRTGTNEASETDEGQVCRGATGEWRRGHAHFRMGEQYQENAGPLHGIPLTLICSRQCVLFTLSFLCRGFPRPMGRYVKLVHRQDPRCI